MKATRPIVLLDCDGVLADFVGGLLGEIREVSGDSPGGASTSITLGGAAALRPGDESPPRPCCHRLGDWWCILPDGHPGPHDAPPPRTLPAVDFGPRAATSTRTGS